MCFLEINNQSLASFRGSLNDEQRGISRAALLFSLSRRWIWVSREVGRPGWRKWKQKQATASPSPVCPLSFLVIWRCGPYRWILHSFAFSYYNNSLKIHSWRGGQDAAKCEVVFWEDFGGGEICGQNGCLKMTRALHLYLILWILCCTWFRVDPTHQLPIYLLKKIYIFPIYCFEDETMQASTQTKSLTKDFNGL